MCKLGVTSVSARGIILVRSEDTTLDNNKSR